MSLALRGEWTKLRTAASTGWLLLGAGALTVAVSATADAAGICTTSAACHPDVTRLSLTGAGAGQAVVAVLAVLAAKAAVVTGLTLAAGTAAVLCCVLAGRLILPGHGLRYPALSLAGGPALRAAAGTVLYLALIALLSLGVAAAVREAAAATGAVLGLLYLFPILAQVVASPAWRRHLEQPGPILLCRRDA